MQLPSAALQTAETREAARRKSGEADEGETSNISTGEEPVEAFIAKQRPPAPETCHLAFVTGVEVHLLKLRRSFMSSSAPIFAPMSGANSFTAKAWVINGEVSSEWITDDQAHIIWEGAYYCCLLLLRL